ncbi:pyrimidine-specific ribonucleoside hydrolase RihA-like [Drosophila busckii]|uniref:pyrimidine-specific ribonucleoside hydrolase RihA-like n=1 Tax=Drosophila busckii TaxID=30019 RepID=UPI0014329BF6|nr:pyrimidine-specific ribonucleoside hydrolase RihA-like [Drosophila busckii]
MEKKERFVVFDCDIGNDDAWALQMLLRAEDYVQSLKDKTPVAGAPHCFKLVGVTCVRGNASVDNTTRNALRVLKTMNRLDVPVFKGCGDAFVPPNWKPSWDFHGIDGLFDVGDYPEVDERELLTQEHAVNAMYRLAIQYQKLDFILVGPLTNFALCINLYGDDFLKKVGNVYVMGGNIYGKGNVTKSGEFNFMMDPEAACVVFERLKKPLLLLPWEPCIDTNMDLPLSWRFDVLGAVPTEFMKLMNRVERKVFKDFVKWLTCDAVLVAAYLFPNLVIEEVKEYYATIELSGTNTRGQLVLDHMKGEVVDSLHGKEANARIIYRLNPKHWRTIFGWTGGLIKDVTIEQLWKAADNSQAC